MLQRVTFKYGHCNCLFVCLSICLPFSISLSHFLCSLPPPPSLSLCRVGVGVVGGVCGSVCVLAGVHVFAYVRERVSVLVCA